MNAEPTTPDADQLTANTAFVAIDKGLLSGKVSEQVEAIVKFPSLFDRHPFPLLINSSMLKLADVFRVGSNFTRLCILRVCQQSERHLDKILNVDEVVRRIFSVIHSNDPVARGLALSTLGSLSAIIPQRKQVHHSIRQALDSRDPAELEAGIVAAGRFAAVSKTFAQNMSERVSEMVQSVTTPVDIKLKLLGILQHMHHDTQTAASVRQLCVRLLPSFPSEQFVITTLKVLTKLAAQTLVDIPEQVELLLSYLSGDVRRAVKAAVLSELLQLSRRAAPLWSAENQAALTRFAADTRHTAEKAAALAVLVELAHSASVRQFDLAPDGPLMRLCQAEAYHQDGRVAVRAVQLLTALAVYCQEQGVRPDITESAVAACDSLLLLLTSAGGADGGRRLRAPLRCAASLARDDATAALLLESVGGLARAAPAGPARRALLEALCAVGCERPHVLAPLASDVMAMLEAPDTDGDTTVQLCTLLLLLHSGGTPWPESEHRALLAAAERVSHWQAYKIARQAMRAVPFEEMDETRSPQVEPTTSVDKVSSRDPDSATHLDASGSSAQASVSTHTEGTDEGPETAERMLDAAAALAGASGERRSMAVESGVAPGASGAVRRSVAAGPPPATMTAATAAAVAAARAGATAAPAAPRTITATQRLRQKRRQWGAALRRDMALLLSQQPTAAQAVRCHLFLEVLPTCDEPQDPMSPGDRNRIENLLHDNVMIYREQFGHHGTASALLRPLLCQVSTEQMQFWLSALLELSEAEAILAAAAPDADMSTLSDAALRYARGLASLRATTSPTEQLEFPVEFCRLRWRSLQAHIHLWAACRTLQTSPPPACVAIAGATGARDDAQRSGRVTAQLQKSGTEFSALADEYGRLHRSAFDADPGSLAVVERLQRCCLLVAQAVNWAVRRTNPDAVSAAACASGPVAANSAEEACSRAAAVVVRAHRLSAGARGVDHHQTAALLTVSRLLTAVPLRLPRRFFQTLQKTVISLSVQPQPRSATELVIPHPIATQLVVKIDGVVAHGPRGAVFRAIAKIQLTVTAVLQGKPPSDSKAQDTTITMSRTVEPHNDYFHGQFLLDLRLPGIHLVTVDANILDADGVQWLTSSSQQLTIRAIDETQQGRGGAHQAGSGSSRPAATAQPAH